MSGSKKHRGLFSRSLVVAFALLMAMSVSIGRNGIASAQDATPSPMVGECDAPALPPGTPTPQEATPEGDDMADMDHGTPAAEEAASPAAEEVVEPAGTPADDATTAEAQAGAQNIINCLMGGNLEGAAALMTSNFVQSYFGMPTVYDVLASGALEGAPYGGAQIGDVLTYDDGSVSVDVSYAQSQYQTAAERWTLIQDEGYWKIDSIEQIEAPAPEGDTAVVGVIMTEYAFTPNVPSVTQMPVITFHLVNQGAEPHEMVLFRLPEGLTIEQVMEDPSLEEQVEFIGFGFALPGEESDAHFVGLEPGVYTMVCFVPAPDGEEHVAKGMVAEFEVTAPTS